MGPIARCAQLGALHGASDDRTQRLERIEEQVNAAASLRRGADGARPAQAARRTGAGSWWTVGFAAAPPSIATIGCSVCDQA